MPNAPTIERRIHFYRSSVGSNPDGSPIPFDPLPALAAINQLSFADVLRGRYLVDQDGDALCAWPGTARNETTLKFCQVRRTDLPQVEQAGHVSDLPIGVTAGLLETVHVVFFPNNIVGAEFNFYGPRLSRLENYLHFKSNGAVPFATFYPLVRGDAAQQLNQLQEIRVLDFRSKHHIFKAFKLQISPWPMRSAPVLRF